MTVLVAASLLGVLAVETAVGESRSAVAAHTEARAAVLAERMLAAALATPLDSAAPAAPAGARILAVTPGESVRVEAVVVQPRLALVRARAAARSGRFRAIAGLWCLAAVRADTGASRGARLAVITPNGCVAVP